MTIPPATENHTRPDRSAMTWRHIPLKKHDKHKKRQRKNQFDTPGVLFARSWFRLGAATAALELLGLRRYKAKTLVGSGLAGLLGYWYASRFEPSHPILERVTLTIPTLPPALDGLRIGQITDIHLGFPYTAQNTTWAIAQMEREQPDLIALTGDLAGLQESIAELPPLLRGLHAPLGIYAVPGNHDYWEGMDDTEGALAMLGIPMLLNEHRRLHWNGIDFWVAGVDDIWYGRPDFARAMCGIPADAFTLMLCHAPDRAEDGADVGANIMLSGHTHGGHLRLPGLHPFTRPTFGVRYVIGQYQVGPMTLYVSRGIGGKPLRFLCPPEATIVTLRRG